MRPAAQAARQHTGVQQGMNVLLPSRVLTGPGAQQHAGPSFVASHSPPCPPPSGRRAWAAATTASDGMAAVPPPPVHTEQSGRPARELTRRIKASRSPGELARVVDCQAHRFNHIHVAAALARLVHISTPVGSSAMQGVLADEDTRAVRSITRLLLPVAVQLAHNMGPRELATVLWALASLGVSQADHTHELQALADAALVTLPQANTQDVGMTLWALARASHHPGGEWLATAVKIVHPKLVHMDAQGLANLGWALATFNFQPSPAWIQAFTRACHGQLDMFTGHGHASTLWALGRMGGTAAAQPSLAWLRRIDALLCEDIKGQFSPQTLSMLLLAMGLAAPRTQLGRAPSPPLLSPHALQNAADAAADWMYALTAPQAASLIWGFAHLGHHPGPKTMSVFFTHTTPSLASLDNSTLSCTMLALQRLAHLPNGQPGKSGGGLAAEGLPSSHLIGDKQAPFAPQTPAMPQGTVQGADHAAVSHVHRVLLPPPDAAEVPAYVPWRTTGASAPQGEERVTAWGQRWVPATRSQGSESGGSDSAQGESSVEQTSRQGGYMSGGAGGGGPAWAPPVSHLQGVASSQCLPGGSRMLGNGQQLPEDWIVQYLVTLQWRMERMPPRQLVGCAYSLAALGVKPPHRWLVRFMAATQGALEDTGEGVAGGKALGVADVLCLASAAARWRLDPPAVWGSALVAAFAASVAQGRGSSPKRAARTLLALAQLQLCPPPHAMDIIRDQFTGRLSEGLVGAQEVRMLLRAAALLPALDLGWAAQLAGGGGDRVVTSEAK